MLQSTSLLRGKTSLPRKSPEIRSCFNPLPSCEGRPVLRIYLYKYIIASIHFPLAREDTLRDLLLPWRSRFNPLPSCEGRLNNRLGTSYSSIASIHFPLAREDNHSCRFPRRIACFNPLPSCEGRHALRRICYRFHLCFNPLPSCEGRLSVYAGFPSTLVLQSTSLLRGKTETASALPDYQGRFNPLPSCEGRQILPLFIGNGSNASIHFPLAREDKYTDPVDAGADCFNPLPSCEGRLATSLAQGEIIVLQSTSLLRGKTFSRKIRALSR